MPSFTPSRRQAFCEILLIFAVFAIQGAWPVPDVNEPYYLARVIHFWQPDWLAGDLFMESANAQWMFCLVFGWPAIWLSPTATAWLIRVVFWAVLALAWRQLSVAVLPRRWWAVLTAALFVCLLEQCHMAGEWVFGGAEAKPFAYALVFFGLASLARNRWNQALLWFGAASAFHVLAGGWSVVATGIGWFWLRWRGRHDMALRPPAIRRLWFGLLGGFLLALPGVVPALLLDWNVNAVTATAAHYIYVFERLPHHLTLSGIKPLFILRFAMLWLLWLLLGQMERRKAAVQNAGAATHSEEDGEYRNLLRLRAFVVGAATIAFLGAAINATMFINENFAAGLLRYYWYRLSDVAIPLGVSLEAMALAAGGTARYPRVTMPRFWIAAAAIIAAVQLGQRIDDRIWPDPPRSHAHLTAFNDWREACRWVANPKNREIPPGAQFFVPRVAQSFKWYTGHGDVADWKSIPQNAGDIVEWRRCMEDIYATGRNWPVGPRWFDQPADIGVERLTKLGRQYSVQFVITQKTQPMRGFPILYQNKTYAVLRIP